MSLHHIAGWSPFALPPQPIDTTPWMPSAAAYYMNTFSNPYFQQLLFCGVILWCSLGILGRIIYNKYVPEVEKKRMTKEQFAGNFTSLIHSIMISISAILVLTNYNQINALNAIGDELIIQFYQHISVISTAYFLLDGIFIGYYRYFGSSKTILFVLHHFIVGMIMSTVLLPHPFICWMSSLLILPELSTICLNVRLFAKIWSCTNIYFLSGWGVLASYPLLRIGLNCYSMFIVGYWSEYLKHFTAPEAPIFLWGSQLFVLLLSTYYFFGIIMIKPKSIYTLKSHRR